MARAARVTRQTVDTTVLPACALLLLGLISIILWRAGDTFASDVYLPLTYLIAAMMIFLAGFEWRRVGHPLTPMGMLALGGLLLFVLRPLSVHSTGLTTAGAMAQTRTFSGLTAEAATVALVQVAVFYMFLGVTYVIVTARRQRAQRPPAPAWVPTDVQARRAGMLLFLAILVALAATALLIQSSGGIAAHFSGVSYRGAFLGGRYFLTLGYVPLVIALSVYVIARRNQHDGRRGWNLYALGSAGVLLIATFVTGGRGPLVLGALLPLLILKQVGRRPFKTPAIITAGVAMIAGAMVMSLAFRENAYTGGAALAALSDDPMQVLLDRLTSGAETRPFDSLILLNEEQLSGGLDWQLGWTYLAVVTWFLPGSIFSWKKGGANTWFTEEHLPSFYYPFRIETSISAIGEAYANFGWIGIIIIAMIVGWAAASLSTRRQGSTLRSTVLYVVLTPLFFSFVRGDSYQNVSLITLAAIVGILMVKLVQDDTGRRHRPWARPDHPGDRALRAARRVLANGADART